MPNSVRFELGGAYAQQQIAFRGLAVVFGAALAAVFVLLLFLYENFATAITILVMPLLAVCAVFIGLWVTGIELNITAMMGMTMIVGIVTEVAIFSSRSLSIWPRDGPFRSRSSKLGKTGCGRSR